jgi:LAO/AO transport system kinase
MPSPVASMICADGGDAVALGRLISRAEAGRRRGALAEVYKASGRAHIVGITGVPGSGKSTLVASWCSRFGRTPQVAVAPTRPARFPADPRQKIPIRANWCSIQGLHTSMARGSTGGLARAALAAADILDVSGFDMIMIETVGVGQDEVEIARASHTTVVVSAPGLGDDVQALKAGILEIADIHVVSKCDRPDANRTITDLKSMLALAASLAAKPVWLVPVVATSSETGQGISELVASIDEHRSVQQAHPLGKERLRHIAEYRALKTAEDLLRSRFAASRSTRLAELVERILRRELDPFAAAETLLNNAAM